MAVKLIDAEKRKYRIAFWYENRHYAKVVNGNKKLAQDLEAKMRSDLAHGAYFPARKKDNTTFKEATDRFLMEFAESKPSKKHYQHNTRSAQKFFGSKLVDEITVEDVRRYRIQQKEDGLHPVTVNHRQKNLRRIFNWLKDVDLFHGENPASGKKIPLENERPYWRKNLLTVEQFEALIKVADERIRPIIICAAYTGMRRGELQRMKRQEVDLDQCGIHIPKSKNGEPGCAPITDNLFSVLEPIVRVLPLPDSPVFDWTNFDKLWESARDKIGQPSLHFHDLRHVFGSYVAMGSKDAYALQHLLRLKTSYLVQRYAHLLQGHLRKAALALDSQLPLIPSQPASAPVQGDLLPQLPPATVAA